MILKVKKERPTGRMIVSGGERLQAQEVSRQAVQRLPEQIQVFENEKQPQAGQKPGNENEPAPAPGPGRGHEAGGAIRDQGRKCQEQHVGRFPAAVKKIAGQQQEKPLAFLRHEKIGCGNYDEEPQKIYGIE